MVLRYLIETENKDNLLEDQSMLMIQISNLSHNFGCDFEQNQTQVIRSGNGPQNPRYSYQIIRTFSPMLYSDFIEYNIVGDTKVF